MDDRFCKKGISHQREESEGFYDSVYATSIEYQKPYRTSAYYNIYRKTLEILISQRSKSILEVGCGCGTFSSLLNASKAKVDYCGFDFSKVGLENARRKCPEYTYVEDNIYTTNLFDTFPYDTVVSHEVLEHLSDDIGFLRRIKSGKLFIGSVPNFDCDSHVRYFTHEKQILFRYSRCINIEKIIFLDNMYLFYGKTLGTGPIPKPE